jgi:DNA-binding MarR family transcriptional regulator
MTAFGDLQGWPRARPPMRSPGRRVDSARPSEDCQVTEQYRGGDTGVRPEESDLAHRLQRLVVRLSRELRWESAEIGLSAADAMALFDLRRHPGSGVSDLARLAGVTRSVISERLKRLEADGLVARDATPKADRRRVGFMVTPGGHAVLKHMSRVRRNQIAARLARLSAQDRKAIERAVDALDRLPQWRSAAELAREAKGQDEEQADESWGRDDHDRGRVRQA